MHKSVIALSICSSSAQAPQTQQELFSEDGLLSWIPTAELDIRTLSPSL